MVWMAGFHFSFDLNQYRFIAPQNFYDDPFWTTQRLCIVSMFLLGAGAGQAVAVDAGQTWARFWRRWGQVAGCAVLVSIGSYIMFPRSWINFGVLHGMAVMLVLLRLWQPRPAVALLAGATFVAAPFFLQHPFFDSRWTDWVGLVTHKPTTEDYVPLAPWFGVMLWGYGLGRAWPALLAGELPNFLRPVFRALAFLGRWSLSYYMLHQPVMLGFLTLTMRA